MRKIMFNGRLVDAWESTNTFWLSFIASEEDKVKVPELIRWINEKGGIMITLDKQPPIRISDLADEE
jgi:hypothetical protein